MEFLLHILNVEDGDKVQSLMCMGLAKLVLSGIISDERVCVPELLQSEVPRYVKC